MPIVLDSPDTETVSVPQPPVETEVALTEAVICHVSIDLPPDNIAATRIVVDWALGYRDGEGHFVPQRTFTNEVAGPTLLQAMSAPVTTGATRYDDLKTGMYGLLQAAGVLPAGTLT